MGVPLFSRVHSHVALWRTWAFLLFLARCLPSLATAPSAAVDWPTLRFVPIVTNHFNSPTCIVNSGDGSDRLFVAERAGKIWMIQNGAVSPQPFLDISSLVISTLPEQGLLGVAFPPGFASKQYFYVYYTAPGSDALGNFNTKIVVSRFALTFQPNVAGLRTEEMILTMSKPDDYHNGGQLAFGPDGFLYIGVGDGGPQGDTHKRAQNLNLFFGKILRIDVESGAIPYAIPSGNPFVGRADALPEIWAYGLRNPWRFSFDRATGDLYIGDVGQWAFEEVDFQPANSRGGENYGWSILEATTPYNAGAITNFTSLVPPIFSYDHASMGGDGGQGSITGGFVYRGPSQPRLDGLYIAGDWAAGAFWGIKKNSDQWATNRLQTESAVRAMSTFGEDEKGNLLVADYYQGTISRIEDSGRAVTPEFSPFGPYLPSPNLRITTQTPGATIHYTLTGDEPWLDDPIVPPDGFLTVSNHTTIAVRAFRDDLLASRTILQTFTYKTATPKLEPRIAGFLTQTNVTITCETPGAKIFYTSDDISYSPKWTNYTGPFTVAGNIPIYTYAIADGYENSDFDAGTYYILRVLPLTYYTPDTQPAAGSTLWLATQTPGAAIYYTLDGSTPTTNSLVYRQPITLDGVVKLNAFGALNGYWDSPLLSTTFYANATAAPSFDPPPYIADAANVTIRCMIPGAVIHYTTDRTIPTESSPIFSASIPILTNNTLILAIAIAPGHTVSQMASASYSVATTEPVFYSPTSRPLVSGSTVSLSCRTPGAVIYYTVDGSDPSPNSPVYTTPITIDHWTRIKAIAAAPLHNTSYLQSSDYSIIDQEATFVSTIAGSTGAGFVDGAGPLARFYAPSAICIDRAGTLYVADRGTYHVRKISPDGMVSTLYGFSTGATGIAVDDAGNLYLGEDDCTIYKVDAAGNYSQFARMDPLYCYSDHLMPLALGPDQSIYGGFRYSLNKADGLGGFTSIASNLFVGVLYSGQILPAVDAATNIYSAASAAIFITHPEGTTELYTGNYGFASDGARLVSGFNSITAAAARAAGEIVVMDGTQVRRLRGDRVTTLAGSANLRGYKDGPGTMALFSPASGLCIGPDGAIYVADTGNNCIRKISVDSTGAGLPDDWQRAHFDTFPVEPEADADGDGINNGLEFLQGTDPRDAASRLSLQTAPALDGTGRLHLRWPTILGKQYQLQFSRDLENWINLGSTVAGDGSTADMLDPNIPDFRAHWFYRVVVVL